MQTINITVPRGWHELSQRQLRYLFFLISEGYSSTAIKTLCLFRWSGLRVISRKQGQFYLRLNKTEFFVTALQIAEAVTSLAWVDSYPKMPVRFERIGRHRAVRADFQGVPFETFIVCENLYQGFLHTQNEELLSQMATHLYESKRVRPDKVQRIAIFYWFASLKDYLSRSSILATVRKFHPAKYVWRNFLYWTDVARIDERSNPCAHQRRYHKRERGAAP